MFLHQLCLKCECIQFESGAVIFEEGEKMNGKMYCLLTGKLAVLKSEADQSPKRQKYFGSSRVRSFNSQQELTITKLESTQRQLSQRFTFTEFTEKKEQQEEKQQTQLLKSKLQPIQKLQLLMQIYGTFVREIELGATFGEKTFSGSLVRSATVVALVKSIVIQINKNDFEPLQRNFQRMAERKEHALISIFPNLGGQYSTANLDSMKYSFNLQIEKMKKYYQGNVLTQEGGSGDQLIYIIVKAPGQFIGEEILFIEPPKYEYACTVVSKSLWVLQGKKIVIENKFFPEEREVMCNSWQAKSVGRQNVFKKLLETSMECNNEKDMASNLYFTKGLDVIKSIRKTNYQQFNNNSKRIELLPLKEDLPNDLTQINNNNNNKQTSNTSREKQQTTTSQLKNQKITPQAQKTIEMIPFVHSDTNLNQKFNTIIKFANTANSFYKREPSPKQKFELPVLDFGKGEKHDHLQTLRRFQRPSKQSSDDQHPFFLKNMEIMNYLKKKTLKKIQKWRKKEKQIGGSVDLDEYQNTFQKDKSTNQTGQIRLYSITQEQNLPAKTYITQQSQKSEDYQTNQKVSPSLNQFQTSSKMINNYSQPVKRATSRFKTTDVKQFSSLSFYSQNPQTLQNDDINLSFSLINLKIFNQQDGQIIYINFIGLFQD